MMYALNGSFLRIFSKKLMRSGIVCVCACCVHVRAARSLAVWSSYETKVGLTPSLLFIQPAPDPGGS